MTATIRGMKDNYSTLSVLSININGMSEEKGWNKPFDILKNKNMDITLIQETHSTENLINKWKKEWLGKSFWNSGIVAKSSGVAILIRKDLNINISTILDKEGRILSLNFPIEKESYQIMNIYAPTRNSKKSNILQNFKKLYWSDTKPNTRRRL